MPSNHPGPLSPDARSPASAPVVPGTLRAAGSDATTDPEGREHVYSQHRDAEHCGTSPSSESVRCPVDTLGRTRYLLDHSPGSGPVLITRAHLASLLSRAEDAPRAPAPGSVVAEALAAVALLRARVSAGAEDSDDTDAALDCLAALADECEELRAEVARDCAVKVLLDAAQRDLATARGHGRIAADEVRALQERIQRATSDAVADAHGREALRVDVRRLTGERDAALARGAVLECERDDAGNDLDEIAQAFGWPRPEPEGGYPALARETAERAALLERVLTAARALCQRCYVGLSLKDLAAEEHELLEAVTAHDAHAGVR